MPKPNLCAPWFVLLASVSPVAGCACLHAQTTTKKTATTTTSPAPAPRPAPAPAPRPAPTPPPPPRPAPAPAPAPRPAPVAAPAPAPRPVTAAPVARPVQSSTATPVHNSAPAASAPSTSPAVHANPVRSSVPVTAEPVRGNLPYRTVNPGNAAGPAPSAPAHSGAIPAPAPRPVASTPPRPGSPSQPAGSAFSRPDGRGFTPRPTATAPETPGLIRREGTSASAGAITRRPAGAPAGRPEPPALIKPDRKGDLVMAGAHGDLHLPKGSIEGRPSGYTFLLNQKGSAAALEHVNDARMHMGGINRMPLPPGRMIVAGSGHMLLRANDGRDFRLRPDGSIAGFRHGEQSARFGFDGRVHSFHEARFDARRGDHGEWHTVSHRADHSTLISYGPHRGYLERPVLFHQRPFVRSTFVVGNHVSVRVYGVYSYHGMEMHRYMRPVAYTPAFYGWAARPFAAPAPYRWAVVGSPAFVAEGGYLPLEPVYPAPSNWLTDFMLVSTTVGEGYLQGRAAGAEQGEAQQGYAAEDADWAAQAPQEADAPQEAQAQEGQAQDGVAALEETEPEVVASQAPAPITPTIKQALAAEIREQVALDSAAPATADADSGLDGLQALLKRPGTVFVVSNDQRAEMAEGSVCRLRPGDTVALDATVESADTAAQLRVASSHAHDCPLNAIVQMPLPAVQDMWNDMRQSMESGLAQLRFDTTGGGLPKPPLSAISAPLRSTLPAELITPEQNLAGLLDKQQKEAEEGANLVSLGAGDGRPR